MNDIKEIIAKNLLNLRLKYKLTQTEVANKINYTDKSISKWENGESVPPVEVLKSLSEIYHVSVDFILTENNDNYDKIYNGKENNANKIIITLLAVSVVWIIATVLFVYSYIFNIQRPWLLFIIAVPLSLIVLLVFNCIWGKKKLTYIIISLLIWTTLTTIYLLFLEVAPWTIFIIGVPIQIALILWSFLKINKKN